jgi:hypothetical protein
VWVEEGVSCKVQPSIPSSDQYSWRYHAGKFSVLCGNPTFLSDHFFLIESKKIVKILR